jgi:hypothetical protein
VGKRRRDGGSCVSRRAAHFVQADVARALRAAKQAGPEWFIEILPGGTIRVAQSLAQDRVPGRDPLAGLAREHDWRL